MFQKSRYISKERDGTLLLKWGCSKRSEEQHPLMSCLTAAEKDIQICCMALGEGLE